VKGTEDCVTIQKYYENMSYQIEKIKFGEGALLDLKTVMGNAGLYGTEDDDGLNGTNKDDKIYGLGGNDTLCSNSGNDQYHFASTNQGNDTITDTSGQDSLMHELSINNMIFTNTAENLILSNTLNSDTITINNNAVENFIFNNEYSITSTQINLLIQAMNEFCSTNGVASWQEALETDKNEAEQLIIGYAQSINV